MPMMTDAHEKRLAPIRVRGVISVHGHRLSRLSRPAIKHHGGYQTPNIFVPKILKTRGAAARRAQGFSTEGRKGAGAPPFRFATPIRQALPPVIGAGAPLPVGPGRRWRVSAFGESILGTKMQRAA